MALEFGHKTLAEFHHFLVALAAGIEIGTAFGTAHGQGGKGILEGLLEGKELHDGQVYRGMETDAALVGADGTVHLHTETAVDLYVSIIVQPRNAEDDHTLRLGDALEDFLIDQIRPVNDVVGQRRRNYSNSLMELGFPGILGLDCGHDSKKITIFAP